MSDEPKGPANATWLSTERHEWGPRLRAEVDAERARLEKIGAVGTAQARWVVRPMDVAIAEELFPLDAFERVARVAEELGVVATPSLDCGQVVVDFDGRRVELAALRQAADPVELVRCLLSGPGKAPAEAGAKE